MRSKEVAVRFSTKRTCNSTDLVLYEYRAYSPSLDRWVSRDPIGEWGGLNLYGFVGNDALQQFDQDGRIFWWLRGCSVRKCTCKTVRITLGTGVQGFIGPAPSPPPGNPPFPPDARGLNVGIPIQYKVEFEGDPKLCKCKYRDSGSITYSYTLFFSDGERVPASGTRNFDQTSDTHDFPCDKPDTVIDMPGIAAVIGPRAGSIAYDLTYAMTVTVTCEGSDGSSRHDSKSIVGHYAGEYQWPAAVK